MERCHREIDAIKADLLSGNPDVEGLYLALAEWSAELRILRDEERRRSGSRRREGERIGEIQGLTV